MSNSLDSDQARHFVGPDLGPNCLQRLSADNTSRQRDFKKSTSLCLNTAEPYISQGTETLVHIVKSKKAFLQGVISIKTLALKAPPIICSRRQFQFLPLFSK